MFYSPKKELILRDLNEDGSAFYQFVYGGEKESLALELSTQLKTILHEDGKYLAYQNSDVNTIEEVLNRVPMFLNMLKHRGYKNILYVGHFNDGQTSWILDEYADRTLDVLPPERSGLGSQIDPNIIVQFLPLLHKAFNYRGGFKVARPTRPQHRGLLYSLYGLNGLRGHMVQASSQYSHGNLDWTVESTEEKFDAVVFLGCPKYDNRAFSFREVYDQFAQYCTPDFELVDLYYGAPDAGKWVGGEKKSTVSDIDVAFTTRSQWDSEIKDCGGRPEEVENFRRMLTVF